MNLIGAGSNASPEDGRGAPTAAQVGNAIEAFLAAARPAGLDAAIEQIAHDHLVLTARRLVAKDQATFTAALEDVANEWGIANSCLAGQLPQVAQALWWHGHPKPPALARARRNFPWGEFGPEAPTILGTAVARLAFEPPPLPWEDAAGGEQEPEPPDVVTVEVQPTTTKSEFVAAVRQGAARWWDEVVEPEQTRTGDYRRRRRDIGDLDRVMRSYVAWLRTRAVRPTPKDREQKVGRFGPAMRAFGERWPEFDNPPQDPDVLRRDVDRARELLAASTRVFAAS